MFFGEKFTEAEYDNVTEVNSTKLDVESEFNESIQQTDIVLHTLNEERGHIVDSNSIDPLEEHTEVTQVIDPFAEHTEVMQVIDPFAEHTEVMQVIDPLAEHTEATQVIDPLAEHAEVMQANNLLTNNKIENSLNKNINKIREKTIPYEAVLKIVNIESLLILSSLDRSEFENEFIINKRKLNKDNLSPEQQEKNRISMCEFLTQLYEAREQRAKKNKAAAQAAPEYQQASPEQQAAYDKQIQGAHTAIEQQESELYGMGATTKAGAGANATQEQRQEHRKVGKQKIKAKIYDQMAKNNPNHATPDWVVDNMAEEIIGDEEGQKTVDAHGKTLALIQSGHMQEAAAILQLIEQKDFSTVHAIFGEVVAMEPNNQLLQSVLNESNRTIYNVDYAKATLSLHTSVPLSNAGRELIGKAVSNPAQFAVLEQGLASGQHYKQGSISIQMSYN